MSEIYYQEGLAIDPKNNFTNQKLGEIYSTSLEFRFFIGAGKQIIDVQIDNFLNEEFNHSFTRFNNSTINPKILVSPSFECR